MPSSTGSSATKALPEIVVDSIGGNCPVQAEGHIDGRPFYFRARGSTWSLSVGDDPIGSPEWTIERFYGEWPAAGWMSLDEATSCILAGAARWRAGEPSSADERDDQAEMDRIMRLSAEAADRLRNQKAD